MKICSLAYEDKVRGWKLNRTEFRPLTLLVGASGVGKTQILNAIRNIMWIADGISIAGLKWNLEFEVDPSNHFVWAGEFEQDQRSEIVKIIDPAKIVSESIIHNGLQIVRRDESSIYFNGVPTVKLAPNKSVVNLIADRPISSIQEALKLTVLTDYTKMSLGSELEYDGSQFPDLESIRNSDEDTARKLYLCSQIAPTVFQQVKQTFTEVFPFVEDIGFERIGTLPPHSAFIQIRERDIENWISAHTLSSGMRRTLLQLSDLYLSADGTVFLLDEFENSLGINCIDEVTEAIVSCGRDLQFIITSHHPYIINNISHEYWKIVTREGGVVSTHDATEFRLGQSKHEAFTQLINLEAYSEGVVA